jgi:hypothetical protein
MIQNLNKEINLNHNLINPFLKQKPSTNYNYYNFHQPVEVLKLRGVEGRYRIQANDRENSRDKAIVEAQLTGDT